MVNKEEEEKRETYKQMSTDDLYWKMSHLVAEMQYLHQLPPSSMTEIGINSAGKEWYICSEIVRERKGNKG